MREISLFANPVLWVALSAWALAQIIKVPVHYVQKRRWDWALLLRAGGMPSSHSALVAATAHGVGLHHGFDTPLFAVSVTLAVIVIYDATGIRRQAGMHAELINAIVEDLSSGRPHWHETQEKLKEVLGHTPFEALAGTLFGLALTQLVWWLGL